VLWGAALSAFGARLGDDATSVAASDVVDAAEAFADAIQQLGHAGLGDKTLLDALLPFVQTLRERVSAGDRLASAWSAAARVAVRAAAATAELRPRVGRARPLADKSLGTPDAGATSMGLVLVAAGEVLARGSSAAASPDGRHL
jgi:dihydroxyacetone kinase